MVDIFQEGHSLRSIPQRRHVTYPGNRAARTGEVMKMHGPPETVHLPGTGRLSCSDLGRTQTTGPTESVPQWSTREPEPERLRPGKCTQPRAHPRKFPSRATWSLSSIDRESTHAVSRGKPSVAETLQVLPTHSSDICLQCPSFPQHD